MKKIIMGVGGPLLIAILIGFILGKYAYRVYKNNLYDTLRSSRLYLVEKGTYDDIDAMRKDNSGTNYVYYRDSDKYKMVVGITKDYDNVKKIKSLYDGKLSVMEYYVANEIINDSFERLCMYSTVYYPFFARLSVDQSLFYHYHSCILRPFNTILFWRICFYI